MERSVASIPANLGVVVSVRGSVVDMRFDEQLPAIYSLLGAGTDRQIVIEVLAQRDACHVRGTAFNALILAAVCSLVWIATEPAISVGSSR